MSDTKTYGPDVLARLAEPASIPLLALQAALSAARKAESAASESLSRAVYAEIQASVPWRKWERGEDFAHYHLDGAFFGVQWHRSGWTAYAHADNHGWHDRAPGDRKPRPTPREALDDLALALHGRRGLARRVRDILTEALGVGDAE